MLTGPQQMPVFSDEVLSSEDKAKVIAYIKETTNTRRRARHPQLWRVQSRCPRTGL
jgi:hypothetical protein